MRELGGKAIETVLGRKRGHEFTHNLKASNSLAVRLTV